MNDLTYIIQAPDGRQSQPLTLGALEGYARGGMVQPQTPIYDMRTGAWLRAYQIPQLQAIFQAQATLPSFGSAAGEPPLAAAARPPRKPMSHVGRAVLISSLVVMIGLCGAGAWGIAKLVQTGIEEANKPEKLVSEDGSVEVTLPGMWKESTELHEDAILQATAGGIDSAYLTVLAEPATDFDPDITLQQYSQITRDQMLQAVKDGAKGPTRTLKIHGRDAIETELRGSVDFVKVIYLHTVVRTPTRFYQIITWATPSDFPRKRAEMEAITASFKELQGEQPEDPEEQDESSDSIEPRAS